MNITCPSCQFQGTGPDDLPAGKTIRCTTCGTIWDLKLPEPVLSASRSVDRGLDANPGSGVSSASMLAIIVGCVVGLVGCIALALTMTLVGWFLAGALLAIVSGLVVLPFDASPKAVEQRSPSLEHSHPEPARERTTVTSPGRLPIAASH